jgi:hypothetical protein
VARKRLEFIYRLLPFDAVAVFLFGAAFFEAFLFAGAFLEAVFLFGALRFETLCFFGALVAARFLAATDLFLLAAVFPSASAFSLAFLLRVLAAFIAAALLWALV